MAKSNPRIKALSEFLRADMSIGDNDLSVASYDKCLITDGSREYLVLSDAEATKRAADYVKDSVWAFKPEFIAGHSKISHSATLKVCEVLQEKCEGANEDITALIKNMKKFTKDAIAADGRAHFLSTYDGHEHEVKVGAKRFYIYRVN